MRSINVIVLGLLVLGGMVAPVHSAGKPSCVGQQCHNTNPVATGCADNSYALSAAPIYAYGTDYLVVGSVELRYSRSCKTKWARVIPNNVVAMPLYNSSYGFMKKYGGVPGYYKKYGAGVINTTQVYAPGRDWMACGGIKTTGGSYYITCTAASMK